MSENIDRDSAIAALNKALFDYEDEAEQAFKDDPELDLAEWFFHRIFVQVMNGKDRQAVLDLPTADVRPVWIPVEERLPEEAGKYLVCGRWRGKQTEIWVCEFMALGCLKGWANNAANPIVSHWMPIPEPPEDGES